MYAQSIEAGYCACQAVDRFKEILQGPDAFQKELSFVLVHGSFRRFQFLEHRIDRPDSLVEFSVLSFAQNGLDGFVEIGFSRIIIFSLAELG